MAHTVEKKAAVVSRLLTGEQSARVAREEGVPPATVSRWRAEVTTEGQKIADISELLLEHLATSLESLTRQAELFGDRQWLEAQDAHSLAILHGVSSDKIHRLLESLAGATEVRR